MRRRVLFGGQFGAVVAGRLTERGTDVPLDRDDYDPHAEWRLIPDGYWSFGAPQESGMDHNTVLPGDVEEVGWDAPQ